MSANTYQPPCEWLCGWCKTICPSINPCTSCCTCIPKCFTCSKCCDCDCCPDWYPREADLVAPEEVTALDYINEEPTPKKGQRKEWSRLKSVFTSLLSFLLGMLLISLYAYAVLYHKSYNIWFCIASTVSLGLFVCIGMAFSLRIRITVFLMLPQLFSGHTRAILLMIILSMAMQGPAANTLDNFQRATGSVSCGVEVAMNQTREIVNKIKEPLMSALKFLKEMAGKVKSVAGKAKHYFHKIWAYMKRIGQTLNHIWAFIDSIGDICNDELLNPHRKCLKAFEDGKKNCLKMGVGPLCYIVDGFTWLCGIAKIATVICVIPSYVGDYITKNVRAPVLHFVNGIKQKFDYNMTISYDLGGTVNSSKSIFTIASDIMEEVKQDLDPYREMLHVFTYTVFLLTIYTYYMALRYLQQYNTDDNHDNIYITRKFVEMDGRRVKQNLRTLLPLSPKESYGLIRPMAFKLTRSEMKGYSFEILNIFRSLLVVSLTILADYAVFWVMASVSSILKGDLIVKAPYILRVNVTGSGFMNDILSQLADALDAIGNKNVTIIAKQCIPNPAEPDYYDYVAIGALYMFTFFASFVGVYVHRLKRAICAYYYPQREQERICFLFNDLLTKRTNLKTALMRSVRMNIADEGHSSVLMILAAHIPGASCITNFLGTTEQYCMGCGKMSTANTSQDFVPCITNGCKGLYCKGCSGILENICVVCMGPLAYKEDVDEELDSSDDEQLNIWIEAMKSLKQKRAEKRRMKVVLKKRLKAVVKRRGLEAEIIKKYKNARKEDSDQETSGFSEGESDASSQLTDYDYQDRSESSGSEAEDWPTFEEHREPPDLIPRRMIYPAGYQSRIGDLERGLDREGRTT